MSEEPNEHVSLIHRFVNITGEKIRALYCVVFFRNFVVKTPSLSAPVGEASERRRSTPMGNWPSETSPIEKYVIGDSPMKLIIYWVSGQKKSVI